MKLLCKMRTWVALTIGITAPVAVHAIKTIPMHRAHHSIQRFASTMWLLPVMVWAGVVEAESTRHNFQWQLLYNEYQETIGIGQVGWERQFMAGVMCTPDGEMSMGLVALQSGKAVNALKAAGARELNQRTRPMGITPTGTGPIIDVSFAVNFGENELLSITRPFYFWDPDRYHEVSPRHLVTSSWWDFHSVRTSARVNFPAQQHFLDENMISAMRKGLHMTVTVGYEALDTISLIGFSRALRRLQCTPRQLTALEKQFRY